MSGSTSEIDTEKQDNNNGSSNAVKKCGLTELIIFIIAIVSGTACSICSKTMMEMHGVGITGEVEQFSKPIFQTFGMFVGMLFGLVMHWAVLIFKIPFPGYDHETTETTSSAVMTDDSEFLLVDKEATEKDALLKKNGDTTADTPHHKTTPIWMYFFLAIPSIFDLAATALCMMGLRSLDVSIYQMLRGSGIIFVALMKQNVLGDRLFMFQWIGVLWNVISVLLVGATAVLNSGGEEASVAPAEAFLGVMLVMAGAFVQALQYVFEEKVMTMDDVAAPPLLLIGMEGLWGTFLCLVVVYPLAYYIPGPDHGSYEDPFNTWDMFMNSKNIQFAFVVYFFAIFSYNLFAVLVTFTLNSVWHAILDNFRPITVWGTDMFIFYVITTSGDFGEPWTKWSFVQLLGMCVLLYGTSVYNAPNPGSIRLLGQWFAFGFNFKHEYEELDLELEEAEQDREWKERQANFLIRRPSSIPGDPTFLALPVPSSHHTGHSAASHLQELIPPREAVVKVTVAATTKEPV